MTDTNQRINWYKTPVDREEFRKLTKRSDAKGLLHMGGFLLLFALTLYGAFYFFQAQMWIPMIAAAYLHGAFRGFMGMESAVHELSHGTVFKSKGLNAFFYNLFSFLSWNSPVHFKASHRAHHHYTIHKEHDKEVWDLPVGLGILQVLAMLTVDIPKMGKYFIPTFAHALGKTQIDYFSWNPLFEKGSKEEKKMIAWARFMIIGHLLLTALFLYYKLWILAVLVSFGYFIGTFYSKGCGMLQHKGLPSEIPDWRAICYNTNLGPLAGFLYCNMQYHIDHHMFAGVPFYNLPKLNKLIRHDFPEPLKGYWRGLAHVFRIDKKQKSDPEYRYWQTLPEGAAPFRMN
ncbi:MAG: fatty acid desaturase [Spirochaetales bacterium]|nr:fatty acid desaturase [Spirochaetales bacterium]